jgi:predicted protein tyrosine phosphatase
MPEKTTADLFRMTICGIDELAGYADQRVTHVLSILDPSTPEPSAFGRYGAHKRLELRFHDVIETNLPGYDPPEPHHVTAVLEFAREMASGDAERPHLLVHCHMGISRSTAAAALVMAASQPERTPADIMTEIARMRAKAWPNLRMIEIGDSMLGRGGALVRAVRNRHRELAASLPQVATFMRDSGRGRELE